MSESIQCANCGGPLPEEGALVGECPRCMLELALKSTTRKSESSGSALGSSNPAAKPADALTLPANIARYRILRVIGEGGMGTVYEAEQDQPRRTVALKIIKPGISTPELLRRFEQESQSLGRLQHPGIAQIYEAGTADTGLGPQPYFAMEFIHGKTLGEYAKAHHLNTRQRLEMVARIAETVQHAHQRGVIHRDLKPANILVDENGQPKILDFGVARATDSDAQATSHTDVGQLVGTLAYMSPEQVLADPMELDTRCDVYALGVILYELLAGRLPYPMSKKLHEAIHAIREEDPSRLSLVNRSYRGDIETIVAKALEKDKTRRYGSAAELAADIERYLNDKPIEARPPSASYQLQKFVRRHQALVAGMTAVFVVLVGGILAATWEAAVARRERDQAIALRKERDVVINVLEKTTVERTAERDRAITLEMEAMDDRNREQHFPRDLDNGIWQRLATESARLSDVGFDNDLEALLARQALLLQRRTANPFYSTLVEKALQEASRAMPWTHNILQGSESDVYTVAFSPDGMHMVSNGPDGGVSIWDLSHPAVPPVLLKGRPGLGAVLFVAFSPDGRHLASGGFEDSGARGSTKTAAPVKIWDLRQPDAAPLLLRGHAQEVQFGTFSRDGTRLVTTDGNTVRLWDMQNLQNPPVLLQLQQRETVRSLAFSPDGTRLAAAASDGIRIWELRNPGASSTLFQAWDSPTWVTFSPDGSKLAAAGRDGARLWNLRNPSSPRILLQGMQIATVVFSPPDGQDVATGGTDSIVRLWELGSAATPAFLLYGHKGSGRALAFSPNGTKLASASLDKTVRVWELQYAGSPLVLGSPVHTERRGAQAVTFSSDGNRVFAGDLYGSVRVWDLQTGGARAPAILLQGDVSQAPLSSLAISRDGMRIALGGTDGDTRVWDVRNSNALPLLLAQRNAPWPESGRGSSRPVRTMTFSPNGLDLAVSSLGANTVWLWDLRNFSARPFEVPGSTGIATVIVFSPDGSRMATGNQLDVGVWDLRKPGSQPLKMTQPIQPRNISAMAFSPDNARLAVGLEGIRVWDLNQPTATPIFLRGFPGFEYESLEFSPDGQLLAGENSSGVVQLWDLRNPRIPPVSFQTAGSIAFSPDSKRLAVGAADGTVRLWSLGLAAADYLCTRVWRNLSMDEWKTYLGDTPYERTCPALPFGAGVPQVLK